MFKPIQVPKQKKLVQYFNSYGLNILLKPSKKRDRFVNEMKVSDAYKPELRDLYLLHQYTLKYRRTTRPAARGQNGLRMALRRPPAEGRRRRFCLFVCLLFPLCVSCGRSRARAIAN